MNELKLGEKVKYFFKVTGNNWDSLCLLAENEQGEMRIINPSHPELEKYRVCFREDITPETAFDRTGNAAKRPAIFIYSEVNSQLLNKRRPEHGSHHTLMRTAYVIVEEKETGKKRLLQFTEQGLAELLQTEGKYEDIAYDSNLNNFYYVKKSPQDNKIGVFAYSAKGKDFEPDKENEPKDIPIQPDKKFKFVKEGELEYILYPDDHEITCADGGTYDYIPGLNSPQKFYDGLKTRIRFETSDHGIATGFYAGELRIDEPLDENKETIQIFKTLTGVIFFLVAEKQENYYSIVMGQKTFLTFWSSCEPLIQTEGEKNFLYYADETGKIVKSKLHFPEFKTPVYIIEKEHRLSKFDKLLANLKWEWFIDVPNKNILEFLQSSVTYLSSIPPGNLDYPNETFVDGIKRFYVEQEAIVGNRTVADVLSSALQNLPSTEKEPGDTFRREDYLQAYLKTMPAKLEKDYSIALQTLLAQLLALMPEIEQIQKAPEESSEKKDPVPEVDTVETLAMKHKLMLIFLLLTIYYDILKRKMNSALSRFSGQEKKLLSGPSEERKTYFEEQKVTSFNGGSDFTSTVEVLSADGEISGLLVSNFYGNCKDPDWIKVDFAVTQTIDEAVEKRTIMLPTLEGLTTIQISKTVPGYVPLEHIKIFDENDEEQEVQITQNRSGEITITCPKPAKNGSYQLEYPKNAPVMAEIDQNKYDTFKEDYFAKHKNQPELQEMETTLIDLPLHLQIFIDKIKDLSPKDKIFAIEKFVRAAGFYDYGNAEVSGRKNNQSIAVRLKIMEERIEEIKAAKPETSHKFAGKKYAGVCADFAILTTTLLRAAGFLSGVATGIHVKDKHGCIKDIHGCSFVIFPDTDENARIFLVDGTANSLLDGDEIEDDVSTIPLEDRQTEAKAEEKKSIIIKLLGFAEKINPAVEKVVKDEAKEMVSQKLSEKELMIIQNIFLALRFGALPKGKVTINQKTLDEFADFFRYSMPGILKSSISNEEKNEEKTEEILQQNLKELLKKETQNLVKDGRAESMDEAVFLANIVLMVALGELENGAAVLKIIKPLLNVKPHPDYKKFEKWKTKKFRKNSSEKK